MTVRRTNDHAGACPHRNMAAGEGQGRRLPGLFQDIGGVKGVGSRVEWSVLPAPVLFAGLLMFKTKPMTLRKAVIKDDRIVFGAVGHKSSSPLCFSNVTVPLLVCS